MPTLTWTGKEDALRAASLVPFRLFEPHPAVEDGIVGDPKAVFASGAGADNLLIQGDNLEHSTWLSMMYPRLELLRELLAEEGSIWVTLDDTEAHYFKVITDELMGRRNFLANVVWQKRTSPDARLKLGDAHDNILVYARNIDALHTNRLSANYENTSAKNPDNDPRGPWTSTDFTAMGWRPNQMYAIVTPNGVTHNPPEGRCWAKVEENFKKLVADNRIWFGKSGDARPRIKNFISEIEGKAPWTW